MKLNWKHIIAGIIASATIYPMTAHADQGVMMNSYEMKDQEGNIVHTYQKGEQIQMVSESNDSYSVSIEHKRYSIDKKMILKTHDEEESSITIKEDYTPLRLVPSLFSQSVQSLNKGEVVQRMQDTILNDEYWIKIMTKNGLVGYVYRDAVEIHYTSTETTTKAYMVQEGTHGDKFFDYGQEVLISNYQEGSFVVKEGETTYLLPESHVAFEKPSKPLILTPLQSFPEQLKVYGSPEYISPVHDKNPRITSRFGWRWGKIHGGTDVGIPIGTPLYAVADGSVKIAVKNQGHSKASWGNYVKIDHGSVDTLYGHMSKVIVSNGQQVKQGQLIGYSGNSGHSTGPHLHFELYKGAERVDSYFIVNQPELYR